MYQLVIVFAIVIIALIFVIYGDLGITFEPASRRAGRAGEEAASNIIKQALREDDCLFRNVEISYDGKRTELDNVIVNKNGVFIIEVKNYSGTLVGDEQDYEWEKYHTSRAGNVYTKTVKNPIRQVKRQIYILARYLEWYGIDVWVEGYAFFLQDNSPVQSEYVLSETADINRTIHARGRNLLTKQTIEEISECLNSSKYEE